MSAISIAALLGIALFVYSYLVYPVLLALITRGKSPETYSLGRTPTEWPTVAVIIAAYNEQKFVAQRIENILSLDYPKDRLKLYIGSDGSKDKTAEIIRSFEDKQVTGRCFPNNRGKASVINDLVNESKEEIIIFSDANTFFEKNALKHLITPFINENVGCVSGELNLVSIGGNNQDGLYWKIEQILKYKESLIKGALGANGAIYGIKRKYWKALKSDTICDDFCIAMNVAAQGGQIIYEPSAKANEEMPSSVEDEYHRRIRIGIGNYQALFRNPEYFLSTNLATRWSYISHKVLRWISPHLLIFSFFATLIGSIQNPTWLAWAAAQIAVFFAGATAFTMQSRGHHLSKVLNILGFIYALNLAFVIASWRYLTGSYSGSWRRTMR